MDEDDVKAIINYLTKGIYPCGFSHGDKRALRKKCKVFVYEKDDDGVLRLFHCGKDGKRCLVVYDEKHKHDILRAAHLDFAGKQAGRVSTDGSGASHNGINVTLRKINERYWWRRQVEDVRSLCMNCTGCCFRRQAFDKEIDGGANEITHPAQFLVKLDEVDDAISTDVSNAKSDNPVPVVQADPVICHSSSFAVNLMSALGELRERQLYCDAILASEDGLYQTHLHKVVLVAASPYLKSLLAMPGSALAEYITLANVPGECLKMLVGYLYSGTVSLTPNNAQGLLGIATSLEISSLIELCQNYLESLQKCIMEEICEETVSKDNATCVSDPNSLKSHIHLDDLKSQDVIRSTDDGPAAQIQEQSTELPFAFGKMKPGRSSYVLARRRERVGVRHSEITDPDWEPHVNSLKSGQPVGLSCHHYGTRKVLMICNSSQPLSQSVSDSNVSTIGGRMTLNTNSCTAISNKTPKSGDVQPLKSYKYLLGSAGGLKLPLLHWYMWLRRRLLRFAVSCASRSLMLKGFQAPFICQLCDVPSFRLRSLLIAHYVHKHLVCRGNLGIPTKTPPEKYHKHSACVTCLRPISQTADRRTDLSLRTKCGWCGQKFNTRYDLLKHRELVHSKLKEVSMLPTVQPKRLVLRNWNCVEKDCNAQFKKKDELSRHMSSMHPSVIYSCHKCAFETHIEIILQRHFRHKHHDRYCCQQCGKAFFKPFLLRIHLYTCHQIQDPLLKLHYCCHSGCSYVSPTKTGLQQHQMKHVESVGFPCYICGKIFKRHIGLEKHINKLHLGLRAFICDKCGGSFVSEPELNAHMTHHADSKPFACQHCSFSTYQKSNLKSHLFSHHQVVSDVRMSVLRCSVCGYSTVRQCRYNEHVRSHRRIRDLPCRYCDKMFITKRMLWRHVSMEHKNSITNKVMDGLVKPVDGSEVTKDIDNIL